MLSSYCKPGTCNIKGDIYGGGDNIFVDGSFVCPICKIVIVGIENIKNYFN